MAGDVSPVAMFDMQRAKFVTNASGATWWCKKHQLLVIESIVYSISIFYIYYIYYTYNSIYSL